MHRSVGFLGLLPPICALALASAASADIFSFIAEEDEQHWTSVTTAFGGIYATEIHPSSDDAPITFATGRVIYFDPPAACLGDRNTLNLSILTPRAHALTPIDTSNLDTLESLTASARITAALADSTPVTLALPSDITLVDPDHAHDPALAGLGSDTIAMDDPIEAQPTPTPDAD
jgi:hypothetical protein